MKVGDTGFNFKLLSRTQDQPARRVGRQALASWLIAASAVLSPGAAGAVDVNSDDYVPAPVGTNLLLFYSQYATRNEYKSTSGTVISNNTSLDSYVDTLRYVRYIDLFGLTSTLQLIVPFGTLYNGEIGGVKLNDAMGISDPILANGIWLLNDPAAGRYFGFTQFLFLPVGRYNDGETLNLGENRWKYNVQAGAYQALGEAFAVELVGDAVFYGANDEGGTGSQRLTQDPTYQIQAWLSYKFQETWKVAVGYSRFWGGTEYLDGIATGNATERDQVRLELSKFITPTFQALGTLQRDFNTSGGFPEDTRVLVRLMQIF